MNKSAYNLQSWLRETKTQKKAFAKQLGIANATFSRILNAHQTPSLQMAMDIEKMTDGLVKSNEWLVQLPPLLRANEIAAVA